MNLFLKDELQGTQKILPMKMSCVIVYSLYLAWETHSFLYNDTFHIIQFVQNITCLHVCVHRFD